LGICHFCSTWLTSFSRLRDCRALPAATGWETRRGPEKDHCKNPECEKAFNLLHTNFDRKDDYPPPRDLTEPIPSGKFAGFRLTRERWDQLLDEYYEMNHWDKKTSFPTRKCLEDLGLNSVADDLQRIGKLGSS
jgi:aldehyde:ferredoxin oxidoreductase